MYKGIIFFGIKFLDFFKNRLSPTMKKTIFILLGLTAVLGPLSLALLLFTKIGLFVQGTLMAISGAAAAANMSVSLLLLKFALMGALALASVLLALALFEDISIFMKGGDSFVGRIINRLNELNEKLKAMNIFTLDKIKILFKSILSAYDNLIEAIVGVFLGKWKFALDSLKNMFKNIFKTIQNIGLALLQPIIDLIHQIPGVENIGKIISKGGGALKQAGSAISTSLQQPVAPGTAAAFNTNINLTLPNDPTPEQMEAVGSGVQSAVSMAIKTASRDLIIAMPELE